MSDNERLPEHLAGAARLSLFLDYDGTLSGFTATPGEVYPDPDLIDLITRLTNHSRLRVAIVSGRPLTQLQVLFPMSGIVLAGVYGIEVKTRDGNVIQRADYDAIRPILETIKPRWSQLADENDGLFLEDKNWSLALHGKLIAEDKVEKLFENARAAAESAAPSPLFRINEGHKFLEVCPAIGSKGMAVRFLVERDGWPDAALVYVGDDLRDEDAFKAINLLGGVSIRVAPTPAPTAARYHLESPASVRMWLGSLLN